MFSEEFDVWTKGLRVCVFDKPHHFLYAPTGWVFTRRRLWLTCLRGWTVGWREADKVKTVSKVFIYFLFELSPCVPLCVGIEAWLNGIFFMYLLHHGSIGFSYHFCFLPGMHWDWLRVCTRPQSRWCQNETHSWISMLCTVMSSDQRMCHCGRQSSAWAPLVQSGNHPP